MEPGICSSFHSCLRLYSRARMSSTLSLSIFSSLNRIWRVFGLFLALAFCFYHSLFIFACCHRWGQVGRIGLPFFFCWIVFCYHFSLNLCRVNRIKIDSPSQVDLPQAQVGWRLRRKRKSGDLGRHGAELAYYTPQASGRDGIDPSERP